MGAATDPVYLLIGHEADPCIRAVGGALRARGGRTVMTPEPLAGEVAFAWSPEGQSGAGALRFVDGTVVAGEALRGVLVRAQGGPYGIEGWNVDDLVYARSEMAAALVAWLWVLPCTVVNRLTPDLWFRPERPLVEWRPLLRRHGIPAASSLICGEVAAARAFAAGWGGAAVYAPLTAELRYPVASEAEWTELGKVMARVPVCLLEPYRDGPLRACVAGAAVMWDRPKMLPDAERGQLERGLRALARDLGVATLEAEVRRGDGGARCYGIGLFPRLERYDEAGQAAIARALAGLLERVP